MVERSIERGRIFNLGRKDSIENVIHILLIEDNPGDVRLIQEMVRKPFSRYYLISSIKTILNLSECPNNI